MQWRSLHITSTYLLTWEAWGEVGVGCNDVPCTSLYSFPGRLTATHSHIFRPRSSWAIVHVGKQLKAQKRSEFVCDVRVGLVCVQKVLRTVFAIWLCVSKFYALEWLSLAQNLFWSSSFVRFGFVFGATTTIIFGRTKGYPWAWVSLIKDYEIITDFTGGGSLWANIIRGRTINFSSPNVRFVERATNMRQFCGKWSISRPSHQ